MRAGPSVIFFLDSSCIVRAPLQDGQPLAMWGAWERAYASDIARIEARRGLYRARSDRRFGENALSNSLLLLEEIEGRLDWCLLTPDVIEMACERSQYGLGTLNAIQLASARSIRRLGEPELVFATHDRQLASSAKTFGFSVDGT